MIFSEAKREFDIRYYLWSISEFEKEVAQSFPLFRLFKTGAVWETFQFMLLLDPAKQRTLAHALLKRFHANAVAELGENISAEEIALRFARDNFRELRRIYGFIVELEAAKQVDIARFWLNQIDRASLRILAGDLFDDDALIRSNLDSLLGSIPRSSEEEIALRKKAGEKIKFISKRKLLKITAERFQRAFSGQCVEVDREDEIDPSLSFEMECHGWALRTDFWFGRHSTLLNYAHIIASDAVFEHDGPKGKYTAPLVMGSGISFASWLGISSQVKWECLSDQEVDPACEGAIKLCNKFFEVVPKLLKGLECDKVTPI